MCLLVFAAGMLHRPDEVALAAVVIFGVIHFDHALALHVGLSGEDEDLERFGRNGSGGNEQQADEKSQQHGLRE